MAILLLQIYTKGGCRLNDRLQSLLDNYQRNNASAILLVQGVPFLRQVGKIAVKVWNGLDPLKIILDVIFFIRAVQVIAVQTKPHKDDLYSELFFEY